ncbi:MAG: OB-fold domain-containing protein [Actinobacteria bacterium]|nr:OB-fold domain-containing protein [Actinomycetota bacterium]
MPSVIPPVPDGDDRFFWDGVADRKLLLQACADCGALRHPPGPMCPRCRSLRWTTQEAEGRGRVYTWLVSHHPTKPDAEPRVVALVELTEGVRMVSNLVDVDRADVVNEMAVEVTFVDYDGTVLPQFRPARGG